MVKNVVAGFAGVKLTPIAMSAPIVILTLAVADSIHILLSLRGLMREGLGKAEAIVEVVDRAVGMKKEIGDEAAIVFAAAFYRKLGFGASVKEAFEEGRVALMLEGIPEEKTPELLVKTGVDTSKLFLVGPDANPS